MGGDAAHAVLTEGTRRRLRTVVDLAADIPPALLSTAPPPLARAELLITGWGCPPLDAAVLDSAPELRAVFHAAGSVKHHLTGAVWDRGLVVSSAAEANAGPVADFAHALIQLASKRALPAAADYAGSGWPAAEEREGADGRTIGVIGASRTGRRVISRLTASDAGYRVLLADPHMTAAGAAELGCTWVPLDDLCRRSSIVSVHAPALPETTHLLNAERLALLPDGATLINTARGSLIDTEALTRACAAGRLNACLDVTSPEPLPPGHPLFSLPNVLITPHLAGAQGSERRRLGDHAVAEVERFLRGEPLRGLVTLADLDRIA
ncbi:hydroxyacid dehydrogenase [Streptomyces sp. URMC 123]|uniref:hydroxyacid dehydrogenase n=1 Tax=Streptomyces sp. URMC 123 TaxID=3423403 RepID=UPI003F1C3B14